MWVLEVSDGSGKPPQEFFFKGPTCSIGRNVEVNNISFHDDKSVSRTHVKLEFVSAVNETATSTAMPAPSMTKLCVTDLNSKFGTFMNEQRLEPNVQVDIPANGTVIKIGGGGSSIRLVNTTLLLCPTRLEKQEKEKLKAKIVNKPESATHVVSTKITATIKSLVAVALKLKCVTLNWLQFCETTNAIELIPPVDRYFPPISEELQVCDISQSRKYVLSKLHIVVLNEVDNQYAYLMKACGATVVPVYSQILQQVSPSEIQQMILQGLNGDRTICFFFDENRGVEPEVEFRAKLSDIAVMWLTAANLAAAVMELKSPSLLKDPPTKIRMTGYSQSQGPFGGTLNRVSDSQVFGMTSQPPLVTAEVKVFPFVADGSWLKTDIKEVSVTELEASNKNPISKRKREDLEAEDVKKSPDNVTNAQKLMKSSFEDNVKSAHVTQQTQRKEEGRLKELQGDNLRNTPELFFIDDSPERGSMKAVAEELSASSVAGVKRSTNDIINTGPSKSSKTSPASSTVNGKTTKTIINECSELEDPTMRRHKQPRLGQVGNVLQVSGANKAIASRESFLSEHILPQNTKTGSSSDSNLPSIRQPTCASSADPDLETEWVSVVRGINKMDILAEQARIIPKIAELDNNRAKLSTSIKLEKELKSFGNDDGSQDVVLEKPITVERNLLSNKRGGSDKPLSSSSSSSSFVSASSSGESSLRNMKRFVKNIVKSSTNVLSVQSMDRVLPRESEREIQLRLEFEANKVKESAMDAMFNERMDTGKKIMASRKR